MKKRFVLIIIIIVCNLHALLSCSSGMKNTKLSENNAEKNTSPDRSGNMIESFPGNSISDTLNPEQLAGEYTVYISNFKAKIRIYIFNNKFYGDIRFEEWGKRLPQPLKDLNISGNKIYFIRSITTAEDMEKYGSARFFRQQFHGFFSDDRKRIKGYYLEAGAEASWWGVRE